MYFRVGTCYLNTVVLSLDSDAFFSMFLSLAQAGLFITENFIAYLHFKKENRVLKSKQYLMILLAGKAILLLHTKIMEDKRRVHLLQNNFYLTVLWLLTLICICVN